MKVTKLYDGTRINQKQFKKWTEALRSGKYERARHRLHSQHGYCCLGVACEVLIDNPIRTDEGHIDGTLPDCQPTAPRWLKKINNDFLNRVAGPNINSLNDTYRLSFDEIADCLEFTYVHGWFE